MITFSLYRTPQGATHSPAIGSAGNVIAALASFFAPGLGQLIQGRLGAALFLFLATSVGYFLWFLVVPGLIALALHLAAILDAATYAPNAQRGTQPRTQPREFPDDAGAFGDRRAFTG